MPSMSAALSALRATGRQHLSASKFGPGQVTGSHVFQIDSYAQVTRVMAKGWMRSDTFNVGGHDWYVQCYPNGFPGYDGFISLFLNLASHYKTGDATAAFGMSILDQASWKPSCTRNSTEVCRFSHTSTHYPSWGWKDFLRHEDLYKEKYLKDDCLTVVCDVTVTGMRTEDHPVAEVPEPELVARASPPFDLHGLFGEDNIWNKQNPDMKIEAGGQTFAVHRRVLEARSPIFKEDLSLASAASAEGAAELRINGMDADVCKALLQFIYTDRLDLYSLETAGMAERLLIAADRYKLEKLKHICETALLPTIRLGSVAASLALAERHHCPQLREACMRFLSSPDNIKALVETDDFEKMKKDCPSALMELLVK